MNLRPQRPERCALPSCATSRYLVVSCELSFATVRYPSRQNLTFSQLLTRQSATSRYLVVSCELSFATVHYPSHYNTNNLIYKLISPIPQLLLLKLVTYFLIVCFHLLIYLFCLNHSLFYL